MYKSIILIYFTLLLVSCSGEKKNVELEQREVATVKKINKIFLLKFGYLNSENKWVCFDIPFAGVAPSITYYIIDSSFNFNTSNIKYNIINDINIEKRLEDISIEIPNDLIVFDNKKTVYNCMNCSSHKYIYIRIYSSIMDISSLEKTYHEYYIDLSSKNLSSDILDYLIKLNEVLRNIKTPILCDEDTLSS